MRLLCSLWYALPGLVQEANIIMAFKRLLDRHLNKRKMEGHGSCTGRRDSFNLPSCSAKTLWSKGPVHVLHCSMLYNKWHHLKLQMKGLSLNEKSHCVYLCNSIVLRHSV